MGGRVLLCGRPCDVAEQLFVKSSSGGEQLEGMSKEEQDEIRQRFRRGPC